MNWSEPEQRVLIIGIGNVLRGDDGAGPVIAERAGHELASPRVRVMTCHQLLPEMCEELSEVDLAVFVDAACDLPPGHVQCGEVADVQDLRPATTHDFGPPGLLTLARQLYGRAPRARVVAVGAESFGYEEALSAPVRQAIDHAVETIRQVVVGR